MAHLETEQLVEIARALNNYSVIWSLKTNLHIHLPSSFVENPQHLLLDWAPQRFILSHLPIRLFISHGGWNSLLESMSAGKVTLVWPLFADQLINGFRLENELEMGRYIKNLNIGDQRRILSSNELERYLKEIFDGEKKYFEKAQQVQQMVIDAQQNSSRKYFEEIIEIIRNQRSHRMNTHNEL